VASDEEQDSEDGFWARFWASLRAWFADVFAPRQTHKIPRKKVELQVDVPFLPPPPGHFQNQRSDEARARRTLGQPPSPSLVEDPGTVQGAPPWEAGGVAPSIDVDEVRPSLMASLFEHQDQCDTEADKAFLNRLIRLLSTDQMDLPPFPDVAWQLDTLLRLGDPPLVRVLKLVRREAALVRRVWTQACSVFYARPPNSLDHAVARIGFDALWRIGMSACLYSEVFWVRGFQDQADEVRQHGIVTADVAAWLSGKKLGAVYLAGLLHDVGKLVIYRAAATTEPVGLPNKDLVDRVAADLHASIGVLVAHAWKLGPEAAAGIGFHHKPEDAPPEYFQTAMQVYVSNIATHTADLSRQGQDCGGLMTLLGVEGIEFDVARTIGKAHEIMDGLENQPDAGEQPILDVVE
jgi:HD-like signal output (HDOD) protein